MKNSYRAIIVGPTGAGKSQFCNFVQRDTNNTINKVSDSLSSCTQDPFSNNFTRQNTNYEFIDTAGSSDSSNNDKENLEKLVNYLKIKKSIDYIILLLKFNERVTKETREYIGILGKIFTPGEFYTHLCVFFTKFPIKPSKKEKKIKDQSIMEINEILKETFNINKNVKTPDVNVYFVDTEYDEEENTYEEKYQETIDIMMKRMKLDVEIYHSINTINLDITGINVKIRTENHKKQIEELKKIIEEQKKEKEKEEKEKIRLQKEIEKEKKNDEVRKKKQKELDELIKKQKIEKKRLEELDRENKRKAEENEKAKKLIEEEARKKGIEIEKLDDIIDGCGTFAKGTAITGGISFLLGLGGLALTTVCPIAGPIMAAFFLGGAGGAAIETAGAGIVAAGSKIAKEIKK